MNERMNAIEVWPQYDTVMVMDNVNTLYPNAGWYRQYSDLAAPAEIPFFNVRNKSVGEAYCNFDSADKIPYGYEIFAIGVYIAAPAVSSMRVGAGDEPIASNQTRCADVFFATEMLRHSSLILKVGQDEKLVAPLSLLPSGEGVHGWSKTIDAANHAAGAAIHNFGDGVVDKKNMWLFPEPVQVPKDRNLSAVLVLSPYLRASLTKAEGPGVLLNTNEATFPDRYPAAAMIRVTMLGRRGVQQRNELAYQ